MKIEEAIRILHPDTTREALSEVEYFGGSEGEKKVLDAVNSACLLACSELQKILSGELVPANRIPNSTVANTTGVKTNPTNAEVIAHALLDFDSLEPEIQENVAEYINAYVKQYITNYGAGFSLGLKQKYMEQNAESTDETALVLVKPKEVTDYLSGLSASKLKFKAQQSDAFAKQAGYEAGYSFDPTRQINQAQREERRVLNGSRG